MRLARQEGPFLVHSRLSVALFMAHSTLRSGTSPNMDDDVAGTQCRSTLRMRRFSFIRRIYPSQAQRWSRIHNNTGEDGSDASSSIGRPVIFASI